MNALQRRLPAAVRPHATFIGVMPYLTLLVGILVLVLLPVFSSYEVTSFNVYDILQNFGVLGLVTLALGLTMIAGEFDLSVASMYSLGGMIAVKTGAAEPAVGFLVALSVGAFVGLVQGGVVSKLRINSMPVTLGGFLTLLGISHVISNSKSVAFSNYDIGATLDAPIAEIFSWRSIIALGVFALAAFAMSFTRLGRDVRAVGGDRRAARTAGVPVDRILIGVFVVAGVVAALPGVLIDYSLSAATPDIGGVDALIFAATAALLGGVGLSGGIGSPVGIAAGILSLSILQELLVILASPDYVSDLITGGLLLFVTMTVAPELGQWWRTVGLGGGFRRPIPVAEPAAGPAPGD